MLEVLFIAVAVVCAPIAVARILYLCGLWALLEPTPPMEMRTIAERIEDIRQSATFMNEQLHARIDRWQSEGIPDWAKIMIGFYARLQILASSCSSSEEEARELARDSSEYIRDHRIKGFFIVEDASRLAELLHEFQHSNAQTLDPK